MGAVRIDSERSKQHLDWFLLNAPVESIVRRTLPKLVIPLLIAGVCAWWWTNRTTAISVADAMPPKRGDGLFAGSDRCLDCHPSQHQSWKASYHAKMTQLATSETVLAPFDGDMEIDGQQFRLWQDDEVFWVEMDDPEWEKALFESGFDSRNEPKRHRIKAQVVMTTGAHHFQAYWIRSDYGRELWQFPLRYDLVEQQWVHRKDVFLGPPEFRPGMHFKVWNDNCIFCHAVGGQPGLDRQTGWMTDTKIAELGIACESCHGPGARHVAKHASLSGDVVVAAERQGSVAVSHDETIVNPAKLNHELSSEICGSCHSNFIHDDQDRMLHGSKFLPGRRLTEFGRFYRPQLESEDDIVSRFWLDGINRSTGREFMGMKDSPCYRQGEMSCLSCHSMHDSDPDDQLSTGMESNEACLQCHQEYRDNLTQHTHHAADSSGSQCYNCHMPHTNYALFKATRSHRITSPVVRTIQHKSRPNACNLCHLDQTLEWTAEHLTNWFAISSPDLATDEKQYPAWALWSLRGDAGQRVVAAWHARWEQAQQVSGTDWMRPVLEQLPHDPYAAVRQVATASLARLPDSSAEESDAEESNAEESKTGESPLNRPVATLDEAAIQQIVERRDDTPIASVE